MGAATDSIDGIPLAKCELRQGEVPYLACGDGEPVLLVHGSLSDCRYWRPQFQGLSQEFRLYAPSLRHYWPHAWSEDAEQSFGVVDHAQEVAAFAEAVVGQAVHLVGHSRGGQVALEVARRYPEKVLTLTLADAVVSFSDAALLETDPESEAGKARAISWIADGRVEEGLSLFIDTVMGAGTWERLNLRRRQMPLDNAMTLLGQQSDRAPSYSAAELAALSMPVLLLNGERSASRYKDMSQRLQNLLPYACLSVIAHAGHAMSAENYRAFNESLRSHFKS